MKNFSLVIQGPLVSRGFDCRPNINRLIQTFSEAADCIVLSTWEGAQIVKPKSRCKIITLTSERPVGIDRRNRRHQWLSSYIGVKYISENVGSDFVLKVRTDQYVPGEITEFIHRFYHGTAIENGGAQRGYILLSNVHRNILFHAGDFFYGGFTEDIRLLLKAGLSFDTEVFQEAVELDLILKFLKRTDSQFPVSFFRLYKQMALFDRFPMSDPIWKYWLDMYSKRFSCFPRDIFRQVEWRGVKMYEDYRNTYHGHQVCQTYFDYHEEWLLLRDNRSQYLKLPVEYQMTERWICDWINFFKVLTGTGTKMFWRNVTMWVDAIRVVGKKTAIEIRNYFRAMRQ